MPSPPPPPATIKTQVGARQRWRKWSDRLRALEEPDNPTYRDILYGPRFTIARRLAIRRRDPGDLLTPQARTGADVARMVLKVRCKFVAGRGALSAVFGCARVVWLDKAG